MTGGRRTKVWLTNELPPLDERLLLRAALLDDEPAADAWRAWQGDHDLQHTHTRALQLIPAVGGNLPAAVLGRDAGVVQGMRRRSWYTNQRLLAELSGAIGVLADAQVDSLICKGAALISGTYPEPASRTMHDADLIVQPSRFEEALAALGAAGWKRRDDRPVPPWKHAVVLDGPEGHQVDLHRWLLHPRFLRDPDPTAWWDRRVGCSVAGRPAWRLHPADELVATCLHTSVRWPLDVAAIARAHADEQFWTQVVQSAREVRSAPLVGTLLAWAVDELCVAVPAAVIDQLQTSPMPWRLRWERGRLEYMARSRWRMYADAERGQGRRPSVRAYQRAVTDEYGDRGRMTGWLQYRRAKRARRRRR